MIFLILSTVYMCTPAMYIARYEGTFFMMVMMIL